MEKNTRSKKLLIGLFLIVLSLFLFIGLVSHRTIDDPSWHYSVEKEPGYRNWGGVVGNFFASNLYLFFGLVSYILVFMVGLWGFLLVFRKEISILPVKVLSIILFILASLSFMELITPSDWTSSKMVSLGGLNGKFLGSFILHHFGSVGAYLLCLFVIFVSIVFATDWLVYDFAYKVYLVSQRVFSYFSRFRQRLDQKQQYKKMIKSALGDIKPPVKEEEQKIAVATGASLEPVVRITKTSPPKELQITKEKKGDFILPGLDLLEDPDIISQTDERDESEEIKERIKIIEQTLSDFGIEVKIVNIEKGPVVTKYEIELAPGISVHKVAGLTDDLSIALKSPNVTVVAPIPGKSTVGIDVPNTYKGIVRLKELITAEVAEEYSLSLFLGKDAAGVPIIRDLDEMPHLLIAGTTGAGKSVCIASIILGFLMKRTSDELKLLMIDPKMVELSAFKDIPHLISPVVTDMKRAPVILQWLVRTMDERYELFLKVGVKKISTYNQLNAKKIKERLAEDGEEPIDIPLKLPYIVVVIDELADLMMAASDDVETAITRISQKSRAVGIHLVIATQRPSVDVITGLIKSNMPARISFKVASKVDSRTILDRNGAERLLGKGDMLFLPPSSTDIIRAQCTFISEKEIHQIVNFLKEQGKPEYDAELLELETRRDLETLEEDPLFEDAVSAILETQRGSVSLIQRRLNIGYSRASRLIEMMAKVGIVGEYKNSKAREVLMSQQEWENIKETSRKQ
jgi:S-DNA-T family DNA segregation ATPase FtsK/SpoIIIE